MCKILAINGSYRQGGTTDQLLQAMLEKLQQQGAEVEHIKLRDTPIEFCLNCRECTQHTGRMPGHCAIHDAMGDVIQRIESADGLILASPTNFGVTTALFKRFQERLTPYLYWPWGQKGPTLRKSKLMRKNAVIVVSSAAPGWLAKLAFNSHRQLRKTATMLGAKPSGLLWAGLASQQKYHRLDDSVRHRAQRLALRLLQPH